jgi:type I restriction enzyme M protein
MAGDSSQETLTNQALEEKEGYVRDYLTGDLIKANPEEVEARQIFLKKLVEEYDYPKSRLETEVTITKGSQKIGSADIVVYHSDVHTVDNIRVIVETKREDRDDGVEQLKSYLAPTPAEFGVWFNGQNIEYFQNRNTAPHFREIPDIPKAGEELKDIGLYQKKDLKPATELKSTFETIHNHIYANEGFLKEKVFTEMLKVIFIKLVDEKSSRQKCKFRVTDSELEDIQQDQSSGFDSRIDDIFERVKREYSDVFDDNEQLNLSSQSLAYAVSQLQKYSLTDTSSDIKGTAFQTFIGPLQRGERGEFFTPRPVVNLCVEALDPQDDEVILDPACGSGGFLVRTMKHVENKYHSNRSDASESDLRDMAVRYADNYIRGIDFNPDLARVAKMYMVLYDDGHTGIFSENSLEDIDQIQRTANRAGVSSGIGEESADIILTNPPFGSKGKIESKSILRQFDLGYKWRKDRKTGRKEKTDDLQSGQPPEILFIERCIEFLDKGGRMAIVIPDSILTNSSTEYVREFIKRKTRILGVVSLPNGTFRQAGVNPHSSVLFLQKLDEDGLKEAKDSNYGIFMASVSELGYELDKKTAKPKYERDDSGTIIKDENGNPILDSDIPEVLEKFEDFKNSEGTEF